MGGYCQQLDRFFPGFIDDPVQFTLILFGLIVLFIVLMHIMLWYNRQEARRELEELRKRHKRETNA